MGFGDYALYKSAFYLLTSWPDLCECGRCIDWLL